MTDVPMGHITQYKVGIWSMPWLLFQVMSNIPKMGQLPTPEGVDKAKAEERKCITP